MVLDWIGRAGVFLLGCNEGFGGLGLGTGGVGKGIPGMYLGWFDRLGMRCWDSAHGGIFQDGNLVFGWRSRGPRGRFGYHSQLILKRHRLGSHL